MEVINNHLYVHLSLNGKGPYTFILDTGDSIITPEGCGGAARADIGQRANRRCG